MNDVQITRSLKIPLPEIRFRFSTSSGPGGQNVNRVATRVDLSFDLKSSPSLTEKQREKLEAALGRYIDKRGVLHLSCQRTRAQHRNREHVLARFQVLLRHALRPRKKRIPTKKPKRATEDRLTAKRRRQATKRLRQKPREADE